MENEATSAFAPAVERPEAAEPASATVPAAPPPAVLTVPVREMPEPGPRLQPRAEDQPEAAGSSEEGDVWHAVVQQLIATEAVTALVRELALQSELIARDGDHWLLRVERESLNQPATRERLRAALAAAGHAERISVETGRVSDTPARRNTAQENADLDRARAIVMNDPFVQAMVQNHGAKIVPGSIRPL